MAISSQVAGNSEAVRSPGKRMSAGDRRTQLLEVAIELFSKHGFDGTTTREIAAAAGVSEAIIFRHFASKEELYAALLDYKNREGGTEEWLDQLRGHAERCDDEALFRSLIRKILDSYRDDPSFQRLLIYSALNAHEFSQILHRSLGIPLYGFLYDYIARRQRQGAFAGLDPGAVIFAVVGMPSYFGMVTKLFGVGVKTASDEVTAENFTRVLFEGLGGKRVVRRRRKTKKKGKV
jgi:TetR/AcrR family transcriptional regulator